MNVDDLGLVQAVRVGGHQLTLRFPVLESTMALGAPPDYRGRPLPSQMVKAYRGRWGNGSKRLCYVTAASASLLLYPMEKMYDSQELKDLGDAYFRWFRIVQEWASVWSGQPLGDFDNSHDSAIHIPTCDRYMTGSGMLAGSVFFGAEPLSRAQLCGALRYASQEQHLPVEHRMLLTAADAQSGGDRRGAVIDAATAAEVALGSYVADHLRGKHLQPEFIDEMIKSANGLMGLHSLCIGVGGAPGVSKNRLMNELANVRNLVVHRGEEPSPEQTILACKHAKSIVQALRSLPEE
jgi:hypothetical protein